MDDEFAIGIVAGICILVALVMSAVLYFNRPPPRHHLYYCQLPTGGFVICGDLDVTISVSNRVQPRGIG